MAIEEERFRYIRNNQTKLRAGLYSGFMDAILRGDSDCSLVGKTVILPSSHTGGPCYREQNYQDAMAICRWARYPDLFLTFTCNPKWPEINEMLRLIEQSGEDIRVDIICRVFQIKLFQLMQDLKKQQPFGKIIACLYTIEFQKRGLPHAHILLFLHPTLKSPSIDHINTMITAEIPNMEVDPDGYKAVKNYMMHGPCGDLNPGCPSMKQGICTKHFPKKFNNQQLLMQMGSQFIREETQGSDRATIGIECSDTPTERDEIKRYIDCIYISATEACWRIFSFDIHHRQPTVERLPFHLQGENTIVFQEERCSESILNRPDIVKTKFTEWFEANKEYEDARELTYSNFHTRWVWDATCKRWTRRKKGKSVGRIYFAHPARGE
ncbi:uncharacterized protein [Solanum lycopersicum]|uniref:uncharacterized protein n=1 Tax=Solanum lycopersicum TaxID=4081 RepID=UPI003749213F